VAGKRLLGSVAAALALAVVAFVALGYRNATAAPLVRRLSVTVPGYPADGRPVRIALFSDVHVHAPDMPPSRLAKIVGQINRLHPDIIVAAGDFTGNNLIGRDYAPGQAIAPLRRLKARFGVYAVLGNNDYEAGSNAVSSALESAGVRVLSNAATVVGPIALGGIDGRIHHRFAGWREARERTYKSLDSLPGVQVLVAHRPDEFVPAPRSVSLVLAGHTHCGQIVLPLVGALESGSDYGTRFLCGVHRDGAKLLVVTAGLGTSHVPLRIGAPPDIWLVTVHGRLHNAGRPLLPPNS
jgi:predicted MPP superfamily phosphohydrolase